MLVEEGRGDGQGWSGRWEVTEWVVCAPTPTSSALRGCASGEGWGLRVEGWASVVCECVSVCKRVLSGSVEQSCTDSLTHIATVERRVNSKMAAVNCEHNTGFCLWSPLVERSDGPDGPTRSPCTTTLMVTLHRNTVGTYYNHQFLTRTHIDAGSSPKRNLSLFMRLQTASGMLRVVPGCRNWLILSRLNIGRLSITCALLPLPTGICMPTMGAYFVDNVETH